MPFATCDQVNALTASVSALEADVAAATTTVENVENISQYADNATAVAAGLPVGKFYRTGDVLKVVHA